VRVAYYSPLPPSRSGIADYSALLLPALRERVEVVIAQPGRLRRNPRADVALYHVGNDPNEHGWIVEALRRRPGVVVLHEFVLHHLVSGLTLARGDVEAYATALEREVGVPGRLLALAVAEGRAAPPWETRAHELPLAGEILDLATTLIVHSQYVEDRAREAGYERPIHRIPMPAWPVPEIAPAEMDGAPLFGCFGHVNESKRVPQLLAAFGRVRGRLPGARLLIVGALSPRLAELDLPEGVEREPYVEETRLWSLVAACDAIVSLRFPTMGETSAAAIRALSLGKPLVVTDVGWFSELPDDVALKVPVGDGEVDALADALELLALDAAHRARMSEAARELARREHALDAVAGLYAEALESAVRPAREAVRA